MKIEETQILVLSEAVTRWGEESQMGMAIEECAEFIVAARKVSRVGGREVKPDAVTNLIDEIADVIVMMEQMAIIYGHEAVRQRVKFKIDRLKTRLEK
jgi:NTP pyrophosphatase (non-canonical NTP hydrolase)